MVGFWWDYSGTPTLVQRWDMTPKELSTPIIIQRWSSDVDLTLWYDV